MDTTTEQRFSLLDLDTATRAEPVVIEPPAEAQAPAPRPRTHEQVLHLAMIQRTAGMDELAVVADRARAAVEAEERRVVELALSQHYLDDRGRLARRDGMPVDGQYGGLALLPAAYRDLAARGPRRADVARENLNTWLPRSESVVHARTMARDDGRAMFAGVSGRYVRLDLDQVAGVLEEVMPADARAELRYGGDGGRWTITVQLARPWSVQVPGRQEPHAVSIRVRSRDDGDASLHVQFRAIRLVCTNGMVRHLSPMNRAIRHVGDPERIAAEMAGALGAVDAAMADYAREWSLAWRTSFFADESRDSSAVERLTGLEALRRLCYHGALPTLGRRRTTAWGQYREAFEAEPGDSRAAVVNAVTRFAHERGGETWKTRWYQEDVEDQAEQVLYRYAYLAPIPPAERQAYR